MDQLTSSQQETCTYTGVFGAMISATCLIQHMIYMLPVWIAYAMIVTYVISLVAFVSLALQRHFAHILLIASAVLVLTTEIYHIMSGVFSLIIILLLMYQIIAITVMFLGDYPKKLKAKAMAMRNEELEWQGKI